MPVAAALCRLRRLMSPPPPLLALLHMRPPARTDLATSTRLSSSSSSSRFAHVQGRLGIHKGSKKFEGPASEMWDHHKTMKCVCDKGFMEIDCSKR